MKKFTTTCIDNETKLEMIYSDCSFNGAMFQLMCEGLDEEGVLNIGTKIVNGRQCDYIQTKQRNYLYDETRGLLLGY